MFHGLLVARRGQYILVDTGVTDLDYEGIWYTFQGAARTINSVILGLFAKAFPDVPIANADAALGFTKPDKGERFVTLSYISVTDKAAQAEGEGWHRLRKEEIVDREVNTRYTIELDGVTTGLEFCNDSLLEIFGEIPEQIHVRVNQAIFVSLYQDLVEAQKEAGTYFGHAKLSDRVRWMRAQAARTDWHKAYHIKKEG